MQKADAIIIGSGQGGVPVAKELAQSGRSVYLFERGPFGGTCVNWGCMPSKALLATAHAAATAKRGRKLGLTMDVSVDFPAIMDRIRHEVVQSITSGVGDELTEAGVHTVKAEAHFVDSQTVTGGDVTVQAPLIVLNTGKSPLIPPIENLSNLSYRTYKDFWDLTHLPETTIVIGGGYVGIELGQALARLGSQVHIIDRSDYIIDTEEQDVSELVMRSLQADGVTFYSGEEATQVAQEGDGVRVTTSGGAVLTGDLLLVAAGRKPNTESLNLSAAGIETNDDGTIAVDDQFRTSADGVYAIGDVAGQPAFSHVSWEDYRRLIDILDGGSRTRRDRTLAYAFFTEPQVGRAGLTAAQAEAEGYSVRTATMPMGIVARAMLSGYEEGFMRMVIDAETDKILGGTIVGPEAAELIHVIVAHMEAGSTWQTLDQSVHIHPALAEGLPNLARKFDSE